MSLDERLRHGLEGLDALETVPPNDVVDSVVLRGHRQRWVRRITIAAVVLAAVVASAVVVPKALDLSRGEPRPATPVGVAGVITTLAGTGTAWSSGDGGPATKAAIEFPIDLGFDDQGNLYFLEFGDPSNAQRVRRVDRGGRITTVVGPGAPGEAGRLVLGSTEGTTGLAVDAEGNVYVGGGGDGPDIVNRVIRVDPSGHVTTVAGTGKPGVSGDGGPARQAELRRVWDVAVDDEGNVYISGQARIRKVDTSGIISTVAGTGETGFSGDGGPAVDAQLSFVTGIAVDPQGNVYFIDYGDERTPDRIRRIDTEGIITTVAGPGAPRGPGECPDAAPSGPASEAQLCGPEHLWVDEDGNVYVADTGGNRIRKIDTDGTITTIAGTGVAGFSGDDGSALNAQLSEPSSVAVGPEGAIYIADSGNNRVRKVRPWAGALE